MGALALITPDKEDKPDTQAIGRLYTDAAAGQVEQVVIVDDHNEAKVHLRQGSPYLVVYPKDFSDDLVIQMEKEKVPVRVEGKGWLEKYQIILSVLVISGMLLVVTTMLTFQPLLGGALRRVPKNGGAKIAPTEVPKERFSDVGGADEIIAEFRQTVEALRNPKRYIDFGVKPLSGYLLYGDPGNGKTLLARAIAGEAGVPFFAMKGSDFSGRYLNEGPRAVRETFAQVRKHGVAILFIDEIDSIASKRSSNDDSGSKELNNTLNELLAQIDGFGKDNDVMLLIIGATNRPDDLDPAIRRPGRLTRHAVMPTPDPKARRIILDIHRKVLTSVSDDVDYDRLAQLTSGMSGAQLADLVNQAGLLALNDESAETPMVTMKHFLDALETVQVGVARKSRVIAERDRDITAVHEGGHALVALLLKDAAKPHRVTIIPRGVSGGHTRMDEGDDMYLTMSQLKARLAAMMGGRAAEKLLLGKDNYTTGAESDLTQATKIATYMVTKVGMGGVYTAQIPLEDGHDPRFGEVTNTINKLVEEAEAEAHRVLSEHQGKLELLRDQLLEKESLDADELNELFGDAVAR